MAIGCFWVAAANLIMVAAALLSSDKAHWLWLAAYFAALTVGELYVSPIGLSLVTRLAPAGFLSMSMGLWLATSFIGNFGAGWLGSFWSGMPKDRFFLTIALVAACAGIAIAAVSRPMRRIIDA
jgi:POT family proton-dependent oligopeptide transporter